MEEFFFIIDTDSYAGNFHRELTDAMTGLNWDEEYGESPVFGDLIEWKNIDEDDYRINAYQEIVTTPGKNEMNSVSIFLSRRPTDDEIAKLMDAAMAFVPKDKHYAHRILGFRLVLVTTSIVERELGKWEMK